MKTQLKKIGTSLHTYDAMDWFALCTTVIVLAACLYMLGLVLTDVTLTR